MERGAASQSRRVSAGEIRPPQGQYSSPNDKHGWSRIPRFYKTPDVSIPAWLGLGATAVALIALTAVLVLRLERQSLFAFQHTYVVILSSLDMLSNLEDTDVRAREYLLTGDPLFLEGYKSSREAVNEEFIRLRELARDHPKEQEEVYKLEDLVHQQLGELQKTVDTRAAAGFDAARTLVLAGRGHHLMDAIRHDIYRMAVEEQITLGRFSRELQWRLRTSVAALTGSALLAGCFLLIGRIVLARITSQRQTAEEDLRTSESRFETLCDQAPLGIYETDAEGRCIYTNRRWTAMSGLSATESLGHGWAKVLHPEDRAAVFEGWQTAAQRGTAWEYRVITDQGETRWIRALGGPIYSALGVLTGYVGTIEDVTERKQAAERFRLVVEAATSGMVMSDRNGKILLVNSRTEKLFGYERKELLGQSIEILVAESSRELFLGLHREFHGESLARVMGFGWEVSARRKDGTQFPVEIGLTPIEEGVSALISITDITERKRAEAKLRESEERFRNMADTAPVLIWVSGPDRLCTFFNKVWLEFTGRTMEQELGKGWAQAVHPDDIERCIATYSAAFDARQCYRIEYRLRRADGEYRWILGDGAPRFTSEGIFAGYIGSCVDITDKRRAEEERQKFVSLAERSLEFVGMSDLEFRPLYINPAGLRLIGLDNLEAARQIRVQDCFFPEDLPFVTNEFFPRVLREGHGEVEIRFRHFKTGDAIWMFYNVFSIYDSGGTNVGWATVSINVSERKQADRALQESAALNRAVLNSLPANIAVLKANGKIQAINEAWEGFAQTNGDPPACAVNIGADYLEVCRGSSAHGSADAEKALAGIQDVLAGRRSSFEMQYPCHSRAEKRWFHMFVTPLAGTGAGAVITHVNITGLKQAEQRFRLAVEAAPSGMVMADHDGKIVLVNSRTEKLFGYRRQELLGQSIEILVPESSRERHVDFRKEFFARPVARPMGVGQDLYARRKDGTRFPVEISLNPIEPDEGHSVLSSIVDITERKRAEAKLRESEERFRVIFFQAAVGIAQTSLDGQWLLLNHRFCEILGYSRDELRGKTFIDITYPDDREAALTASRKLLAGEISSWSSEKRYIGKDGITVWARLFVSLVRDQHNEAQYFVSVVEDITDKIQAERALQQSRQELRALAGRLIDAEEEERKRIARELHDDLSQKLALLAFDTGSLVLAPPPSANQTREKFRDLQTRVVQLSEDVRQISHRLHPSILEDLGLTAALRELCEEFSAREGIEVVFEQEAVPKALPVDVASCLYRVSQEALHNVIKHSRATRVHLKVSGSPEGIQLRIHDTGVGFDSESASHGLGIVSMKERVLLVQGEFSIHSQPGQGTTVEIFVPLSKEPI